MERHPSAQIAQGHKQLALTLSGHRQNTDIPTRNKDDIWIGPTQHIHKLIVTG